MRPATPEQTHKSVPLMLISMVLPARANGQEPPPRRHCSCRRLGAAAGVVLAALVVLTTLPRCLVAGMIIRR